MPIPSADLACVPLEKLSGYLLDEDHSVGGAKAKWFVSAGFDPAHPAVLEQALLTLVRSSDDYVTLHSQFGTKYVVVGNLDSPNGRQHLVTTVWIVEPPDDRPRLVTAYPGDHR